MSLEHIKLQRVLQEFRTIQKDINAQTILAFVFIANRDEQGLTTTVLEVGNFLGCSSASASRNVSILAGLTYRHTKGHGLVYAEENPERRIEKFIRLTDEGKQLSKMIKEYLS